MPFQSWELRPHATNSCLFTLIAAIIELEIEIKVTWLYNLVISIRFEIGGYPRKQKETAKTISTMRSIFVI